MTKSWKLPVRSELKASWSAGSGSDRGNADGAAQLVDVRAVGLRSLG
jgi:hypothetical protein